MKIFNIPFLQNNNIAIVPKHNSLGPLPFDTVTFSGRPIKDIPYSIFQKERELDAIRPVLKEAAANSELLSAEDISDKTGLDIYVVKLRLSTNSEIRQLCNDMKLAHSARTENENLAKIQELQGFIKQLNMLGKKLTDAEIAFYLGLKKDELLQLLKEDLMLEPIYDEVLLKTNPPTLLERKAQNSKIHYALQHIGKKDTYDTVAKRAKLSPEIIRARINEDDELFNRLTEKRLYPPDVYPDSEIEEQDDAVMNALLSGLKYQKQMSIAQIAESAGLFPGVVLIRIKDNEALQGAYNRMMGIEEDED